MQSSAQYNSALCFIYNFFVIHIVLGSMATLAVWGEVRLFCFYKVRTRYQMKRLVFSSTIHMRACVLLKSPHQNHFRFLVLITKLFTYFQNYTKFTLNCKWWSVINVRFVLGTKGTVQ